MTSAPGQPGRDDAAEPAPDGLGEAIRTGRVPVVPGSLVDLVMRSGSGGAPSSDAPSSGPPRPDEPEPPRPDEPEPPRSDGAEPGPRTPEPRPDGAGREQRPDGAGPVPAADTGTSGSPSPTRTGFTDLVARGGTPSETQPETQPGAVGTGPSGARPTPAPRPTSSGEDTDERAGDREDAGVTAFGPGDDSYADLGDLGDDPLGLGPLAADTADTADTERTADADDTVVPGGAVSAATTASPDDTDGPGDAGTTTGSGTGATGATAGTGATRTGATAGTDTGGTGGTRDDAGANPISGTGAAGVGSADPLHTPADRFAPPPSFAPDNPDDAGVTGPSTATPATGRPRMNGGPVGTDGVPVTAPAPTVVPPIAPTPRPLDEDSPDETPDASSAVPAEGPAPDTPSGGSETGSSKRWPPRPSRPGSDGPETDILPPGALIGHYPGASTEDAPAEAAARPETPSGGHRPTMPGRRRSAPSGTEQPPAARPAMGGPPSGPAMAGLSGSDLFATPGGEQGGGGFGRLPGRDRDPWAAPRRDDGPRDDSPRNDGSRNDGPRNDSPRDDGPREDSARKDSPRKDDPRDGTAGRAERPDDGVPDPTRGRERGTAASWAPPHHRNGRAPQDGGSATAAFPAREARTATGPQPAPAPDGDGAPGGTGTFRAAAGPAGAPPRRPGPPPDRSPWGPPEGRPPHGPDAPRSGQAPPRPAPARPDAPPASAAAATETMPALDVDGRPLTAGPAGGTAVEGTAPVPARPPGPETPDGGPDPVSRTAAAAASVGAVSVAAARAASGSDGTDSTDGADGTASDTGPQQSRAGKPIAPRREAIMSATPRNGRRGVSPAGLAIALAIMLLGGLTLWAMLSPTPQNDGGTGAPAAVGAAVPGIGPRPAPAPAAVSLPRPTVRATVPAGAEPVAVTASSGGAALVAVRDANRLLVLDPATDAVTAEIPLPAAPQGVTASPDGTRAFVSMSDGDGGQIAVVDVPGATVVNTVPVAADPAGAVTSADGRFLYVPSRADGVVDELDPYAGVVTRSVPLPDAPFAAATGGAGDRVHLAGGEPGRLTVLDPNSLTVLVSFPVAGGAEAVAATPPSAPEPRVAVAGPDDDTVTVLNPADGREIARVEADGGPTGLAFAADGRHLYVTTGQGLQVVDTATWQVTGTTDVALDPTAVAVSADGRTGWVTGNGEVSVLNLS